MHLAAIKIFGRYTYDKMITGSFFIDEKNIEDIRSSSIFFVANSWTSFAKSAFKHNNRLFLEHYKKSSLGLPPPQHERITAIGYSVDTIIFGPSRRLEVIKEFEGLPEEIKLETPHIPTDYWNPAYITYEDAKLLGEDNLMIYTSKLSHWLSEIFSYSSIVSTSQISEEKSKIMGTQMLLKDLFYKIKNKEEVIKYTGSNKEYFLHLTEDYLYKLLLLGLSDSLQEDRRTLKNFLKDPIKYGSITIILRGLDENIPNIFKEITLTQADIQHWKDIGVYETYLFSLRTYLIDAKDLEPSSILANLREPISQFGNALKNLAKRYGALNKRLYIIPVFSYTHGFGQKVSRPSIHYVQAAQDIFSQPHPSRTKWNSWELDGTNQVLLEQFSTKYKYVLRSLLEGRYSLFIVAVDKSTGTFEHICDFNILQGSMRPEILYFTNKDGYRTFNNIEEFDNEFSSQIDDIMNLFRSYQLPFVPKSDKEDISDLYDFPF